MTRRELEVYREGAKVQLSWARRRGAGRELLDVLRLHIDGLSEAIEQPSSANQLPSSNTIRRYAS
jgi:hypothetical protein